MAETAEKSEPRITLETASRLFGDWRRLLVRGVEEAEEFTREKPTAGLAAAFLAGIVTGSFFRRR